jgi:hypothetical protein
MIIDRLPVHGILVVDCAIGLSLFCMKYKHPIPTIPPNKEQELATPPGLGASEI